MQRPSDEELMAYADGQLDEVRRAEIQQAETRDEEVQRRVAQFRQSAVLLKAAYDATLQEAVPQHLIDTVKGGSTAEAPTLRERLAAIFRMPTLWRPAYAFAALAILLVGVGLGYQVGHAPDSGRVDISLAQHSEAFQRGLDTTASGQWFSLEQEKVRILPVATFQDQSSAYCRPYDVAIAEASLPVAQGIACRDAAGHWDTKVYIATGPAGMDTQTPPPGYIPASADDHDFVMAIADQLMVAPPLSPEAEAALMAAEWGHRPTSE